jgi:hypothetical protein
MDQGIDREPDRETNAMSVPFNATTTHAAAASKA